MEDENLSSESIDKRNGVRLWILSWRGVLKCSDKLFVWFVRFFLCLFFIRVIEWLEGKKGSIFYFFLLIFECCNNFESKMYFVGWVSGV